MSDFSHCYTLTTLQGIPLLIWTTFESLRIDLDVVMERHCQHVPAKVVKLLFYEPEWKKK
jgi:hypothetical protein